MSSKSYSFILPCIILLTMVLFGTQCSRSSTSPESPVKVMSYNIRYDNPADSANAWPNRKERVVSLISFYEPDFLGTQEALPHQVQYLDEQLENMGRIGQGREGGEEGEFSALYYNRQRFELVEGTDSTLWLSETPGTPSKSWDAALPRIVTFGRFRDKPEGGEWYVFNTHFDHLGDTARVRSARLLLNTIKEVESGHPVVLTGDFNATPGSRPYEILNGSNTLEDAYHAVGDDHVGPHFTFEGFKVDGGEHPRRIDYIFVNDRVEVHRHAIISSYREGYYPSDHLPVYAEVGIK